MIVLPTGDLARRILNSPCRVVKTLDHNKDQRDGIIQYNTGINKSPRKVETQFRGSAITDDTGSKTENKFVIIFKIF